MAAEDKRVTDLTEKTTANDNSLVHFVDVDDVTQNSSGSSFKIKKSSFLKDNLLKKTIAQIRAFTGILPNTNFYTTDLGQEGNWYYDATDTTSVDNTGTILVTADGKRIKRVINYGVNIKWFGAKGDSSYGYIRNQSGATQGNDDGQAIQDAIDYCLVTGQKLVVPVGVYRSTIPIVISYPNGLKMEGDGTPYEISLTQYTNGTSPLYKGVIFFRDYTGAPLFSFNGGLNTADANWSTFRDGKMWKTDIKNIGWMDRTGITTNVTSLIMAKRSILMRFKNCLFLGSATSNFEGFQIDDSVFDDCRFVSGGGRIESPNVLLHRVTTVAGETTYSEATNSLTFIACIFEGHNGRNLLTAPASYTRADGTVFTESGSISALQILGGVFKYPNLKNSSSLNNVELNNVSSANCTFAISHKGCIDGSTSSSTEIFKLFNSFNSYFNIQAEKLANANLTINNFITCVGGTSINIDCQLTDGSAGIAGTEAVNISGGSLNIVRGSVSTVTGTKILTNNHVQYFPNKTAPSASVGGVTIYADTSNRFSLINDSGVTSPIATLGLDNTFTAKQFINPTLNAVANVARPFYVKPVLNAVADNDFLYAYAFEPTFNVNGFTGVKRLFTTILNGGTFQLNGSSGNLEVNPTGTELYFSGGTNNFLNAPSSGASLSLKANVYAGIQSSLNVSYFRVIMATGNVLMQNGGTFTDNGVDRLQVAGTISASAATNANQVVVKSQLDASKPYKVYTALLTQTGTSAPTAIVLDNTLGGTIVWTRNVQGTYTGTLNGAFTTNKTALFHTVTNSNSISMNSNNSNSVVISVNNFSAGAIDGGLANTTIEIRVYN